MRSLFIAIVFTLLSVSVSSQVTRQGNLPSDGDKWVKTRAEVNPGDAGSKRIWYYNAARSGDSRVSSVLTRDSGITISDRGWLHHYILSGDSLLETGRENRLSETRYLSPSVSVIYPFRLGDNTASAHRGITCYGDRLYVGFRGTASVSADAYGIMTDGADTLRNVLRVCRRYDFVQTATLVRAEAENFACHDSVDAAETLHILELDYEWFSPGSRYPVMGCHESYVIADTDTIRRSRDAYLSLPESQNYDLGETVAPQQTPHTSDPTLPQADPDVNNANGILSNVKAIMPPGSNSVEVTYDLNRECDIILAIHDAIGRQLARSVRLGSSPGSQSGQLTLSFKPIGVVMLIVTVNDVPHLYKIGN